MIWQCIVSSLLILITQAKHRTLPKIDRIGYFWHIDTLNLNMNFSQHGDVNKNCVPVARHSSFLTPSGPYGDYSCDSPLLLLKSAITFMKKVKQEEFDFILWTGDSSPQQPPTASSLPYLRELSSLLRTEFPYSSVYPALGDMDFSPPAQARPHSDPVYLEAAELWNTWLPPKAVDTLRRGGYYKIELGRTKLWLICLNTNIYLEDNDLTNRDYNQDPGLQWDWLHTTLDQARIKHQNVIIFGHAPPGKYERSYKGPGKSWLQNRFNRKYIKLIHKYSDVVSGQFFGHHNSDSFRVFYNNRKQPVSWALISPGLSPRTIVEGIKHSVISNPSIRLYRYSTYNGKVDDYSQFSLPLAESNLAGEAGWSLQYNFSSYYDQSRLTAQSLHDLAASMAVDRPVFERYLLANTAWAEGPLHCGPDCRRYQLCAIRHLDYANFDSCILGQISGTARTKGISPGVWMFILVLVRITGIGSGWNKHITTVLTVIVLTQPATTIPLTLTLC